MSVVGQRLATVWPAAPAISRVLSVTDPRHLAALARLSADYVPGNALHQGADVVAEPVGEAVAARRL